MLKETVRKTSKGEDYAEVADLEKDDIFFRHNKRVNGSASDEPAHAVIASYLCAHGEDFRFETAENPVPELASRVQDNTTVGLGG